MRKLILITGIPGTGKTTIGKRLEETHTFEHIDLEDCPIQELFKNPIVFIDNLLNGQKNIVVTWGFAPDDAQTEIVLKFKDKNFKLIWFDGNREAAKRAFNKRGDVPEKLFGQQLSRIENSHIVSKINPHIINTFKQNETFKSPDDIIKEIFEISQSE